MDRHKPEDGFDSYVDDFRLRRTRLDWWITVITIGVVVAIGLTLVAYIWHNKAPKSWRDAPYVSQVV